MLEDLKRKDFIGVCRLEPDVVFAADFVKETTKLFKTSKPFFRFLCEALSVSV